MPDLSTTPALLMPASSAPALPPPGGVEEHPVAKPTAVTSRLLGRAARDDRGQATAEYALVIIVAATIAVAVITWAAQSGAITGFFDAVVERLTGFL